MFHFILQTLTTNQVMLQVTYFVQTNSLSGETINLQK
jgi:hypothetical protein